MTERVTVSAPGKLMLFGEHAVVYGKPCLVTAVDQRMSVSVEQSVGNKIHLSAPDVGLSDYKASLHTAPDELPKQAKFVWAAVNNFFRNNKTPSGLSIVTKSEFSSEFGFGSSSAVTVGVVKALAKAFEINLSNNELFDLCYRSVLDVQGVGSGFDLAAAIWGGTLLFVKGGEKIHQFRIGELPLVVGFTGIKADTTTLVMQVADLRIKDPQKVNEIFDLMGNIVGEAKKALQVENFERLGELANINQGLLNALGVSSVELENLIHSARQAGAYGAKLSGAGGGDCMIAFVSHKVNSKTVSSIR